MHNTYQMNNNPAARRRSRSYSMVNLQSVCYFRPATTTNTSNALYIHFVVRVLLPPTGVILVHTQWKATSPRATSAGQPVL